MNLYILAGALRAKRPVPTYLPSAAAARKRLLDRMAEIEEEDEALAEVRPRPEKTRRWADVYRMSLFIRSFASRVLTWDDFGRIRVFIGFDGYCARVGATAEIYESDYG